MQTDKYSVVVVDLGTDKIKAALAEKLPDGTLDILERTEIPAEGCIVRGVVFNQRITAEKLSLLLQELEETTHGTERITKVYTGIGGQGLRSKIEEHDLPFPDEREITAEDLTDLSQRLLEDQDSPYTTLDSVDPLYHVNGNLTANPVGIKAKSLRVRSQRILTKRQIPDSIRDVIVDKLGLEIANINVSPIILGNTFLTKEQKKLGSAIIDFGCGCTTVALYNNGVLAGLRTFPLGSQNITLDLTALHIGVSEAERVKKNDGSADASKAKDEQILVKNADERSSRQIPLYEINQYVEARTREIVDNIAAFVHEVLGENSLPGGVVLTGGGSKLKELPQLITNVLQTKVELSTKTNDLGNTYYIANPEWNLVYSMCLEADTPCTEPVVVPQPEEKRQDNPPLNPPVTDFPEDDELPEQKPLIPDDLLGERIKKEQQDTKPNTVKRRNKKTEKKSGLGFKGWIEGFLNPLMPPEDDEDNM